MTKIQEIFNYKELLQVNNPETGLRHYEDDLGHKFPSVTTILSATSDKTYLEEWRKRIGDHEADKIVQTSQNIGNNLHKFLENYLHDIEQPKLKGMLEMKSMKMAKIIIEKGLSKMEGFYASEKHLYSIEHGYAGTVDLVGQYKSDLIIGDFKNSRKMKTIDQILDYRHQVSAYALAHNEIHGTNICQGIIFMVDRDYQYEDFYVGEHEMKHLQEEFLERVVIFYKSFNA